MRTAFLLWLAPLFCVGCLVPELDNYPADKSKGAGTIVYGQDAVDSGPTEDTGSQEQGCQTFQGNLQLNGSGTSPPLANVCYVNGSVFVGPNVIAEQIYALQAMKTISGTLTLARTNTSDRLTLTSLTSVQTVLVDASNVSNSLVFPALQNAAAIMVQNNSYLMELDLSALYTVQQLFLTNNQALQTPVIQDTVSVSGQWKICNCPNVSTTWLESFRQAHLSTAQGCP